jgi:hypothetical protein
MTSKWNEYRFPVNAFQGYYKVKVNKDLTLKFDFIPNENCTFEIKPWKYHFFR